jgi:hypothetical protein
VPVLKSTILAVMVRRVGEAGLKAVLEADPSLCVAPEEVESSNSFPLEFPRGADGRLSSLDLTIAIESEDFSCRAPQKILPVPPKGDSAVCVFLLEAKRAGALVLVVNISASGKVILTRVLRSEGVAEASFQPVVEELPGFNIGEEGPPTQEMAAPVAYMPSPAAPGPTVFAPPPPAGKPFSMRSMSTVLATVLLVLIGLGAWYTHLRQQKQEVVSLTQPSVQPAGPPPPASSPPATPPAAQPAAPFGDLGSAARPVAPPETAQPASPPVYQAQDNHPTAAPKTQVASPPQSPVPANYQLCAFGSGSRVLAIRGYLSLAQIPNGLDAICGFTGTGETYDVTIHWQFAGESRSESTETTTLVAGNAVSVASSGPKWAYNGPLGPGVLQVTVHSVRRSDGRENSWNGVVQLSR